MAKCINRIKGGRRPIFQCPCGKQINPQEKGLKPAFARVLYCASSCGFYQANLPKSK